MGELPAGGTGLEELIGREVVLDVRAPILYIGTLAAVEGQVLVLRDADVHLCGDSRSTAELYVMETKKNGIRANRRLVRVMRTEIVSISRLDDVIVY